MHNPESQAPYSSPPPLFFHFISGNVSSLSSPTSGSNAGLIGFALAISVDCKHGENTLQGGRLEEKSASVGVRCSCQREVGTSSMLVALQKALRTAVGVPPRPLQADACRGRSGGRSGNWQSLQGLVRSWVGVFAAEQRRCRVPKGVVKHGARRSTVVGKNL